MTRWNTCGVLMTALSKADEGEVKLEAETKQRGVYDGKGTEQHQARLQD